MSKKILALLLSLMMILSQSTMCFGEVLAEDEGADPVLESIIAEPSELKVPVAYTDEAVIEKFVKNNIVVKAVFDDESTQTVKKENHTVTFGDNLATVTYEGFTDTIALTIEQEPSNPPAQSYEFEFENGLDDVTSSNAGISITHEDGKLKGVMTENEKYLFVPVDGIDTSYYDGMKISIKVTNAVDTTWGSKTYLAKNAQFSFFFEGTDKATGNKVDYAGGSSKNVYLTGLAEQPDGSYINTESVEYIIDFSAINGWTSTNATKLRIDPIRHLRGTFEIDYIRFYHKEVETIEVAPAAMEVPETESDVENYVKSRISSLTAIYNDGTTAVVTTGYTVAVDEEVATVTYEGKTAAIALTYVEAVVPPAPSSSIIFGFDTELDDDVTSSNNSKLAISVADGKLVGNITAVEQNLYVTLNNIDGSYYNSMKMRIKVTSAADNGTWRAENATFDVFFKGTNKETGEDVSYADGAKHKVIQMENMTAQPDGTYKNSDFKEYTVDMSTVVGWNDTCISNLRIDPLRHLLGSFEIDYIELYHRELTGISVLPETLTVPYANRNNIQGFVERAITSVTATYSDNSTADVTTGYTVAIDGEVATVTYEEFTDTIALTMETEPQAGAPIVWDFESTKTGVTVKNWNSNVLTASLENGALKCDYLYESGERSYLFFDLSNIDGEYYNTLKIRAKVVGLAMANNFARMYYDGTDKVTGDTYSANKERTKSFSYTGLTESDGIWSNADYVDYEIDLSSINKWSDSTITRIRIDGLNNTSAVIYFDSVEIYHKELTGITVAPSAMEVPLSQQATAADYVKSHISSVIAVYNDGSEIEAEDYTVTVEENTATVTYMDKTATIDLTFVEEVIPPTPDDEVAEGEEYILYDFNEGTDGFTKSGDVTISQIVTDDGITALEYISSVDTAAGKTETGFIAKNVNYNPGQVYKIEMRVKFVGVTPVFGTGTTPAYNVIYAGSIDGKEFGGDSHHQITGTYSDIELTEGEYWSKDGDWHIVTIDPTKANGTKTKSDGTVVEVNWGKSIIEQIRFDILKKSNGIVLVDYIKMYSVPSVTDIVFDNGGISASAVPVGTEKITLTLSDSLYEVKKNAVSVVSADGVSVEVKGVSHEKSTNKVVITIGELDSMTEYAVLINSNALANERQSLYKAIKATFTTEKGVLECNATGDGNSAEFTFVNAGESKNVVLVATVWDGDKYVGKYTQPYQIAAGDTTYTSFNYSSVLGGDRAEVTVWDYADGTVKTVYGKKVFTFER